MSGWWRVARRRRWHDRRSRIGSAHTASGPLDRSGPPRRLGHRRNREGRPQVTPVPLATLPDDVATQVGDAGVKQVNLYRCLAHAPDLLRAWISFAWALRGNSATSRRMRELMILRTAMLHESHYEWHQHIHMATSLGVSAEEVAELESWETSSMF